MEVILSPNAEKRLKNLSSPDQKKVLRKLRALRRNPLLGKKLTKELKGLHSVRAWPYRIIYWVDVKEKAVKVTDIRHRQEVYGK